MNMYMLVWVLCAVVVCLILFWLADSCLYDIDSLCCDWIDYRLESINRVFDFEIKNMQLRYAGNSTWSVLGSDYGGISSIRMFWLLKRFQWSGYSRERLDVISYVCEQTHNAEYLRQSKTKPF